MFPADAEIPGNNALPTDILRTFLAKPDWNLDQNFLDKSKTVALYMYIATKHFCIEAETRHRQIEDGTTWIPEESRKPPPRMRTTAVARYIDMLGSFQNAQ